MNVNIPNFVEVLLQFLDMNNIKNVTTQPLFGCVGLCFNGKTFAHAKENQLYLKAHPAYIATFNALEMAQMQFDVTVRPKFLQYYLVTDELWADEKRLIEIIKMVLEHLDDEYGRYQLKEPRLKDLPNITLSLERQLIRSGIQNVEALKELGAIKTYFKLQQNNCVVSNNILFSLHSALAGVHVAVLSDEEKHHLIDEYHAFSTDDAINHPTFQNG